MFAKRDTERDSFITVSSTGQDHLQSSQNNARFSLPASPVQLTVRRKPVPQHTYAAIQSDSEDMLPYVDRKLLAWRPSYLKLPVLGVFVVIFCVLIAALEAMYQVSRRRNGLANSDQRLHYLWTYGPSAVLILIATFWARIEYQLKELAPWLSMAGKPTEAKKSVLLDYVSALQPVSIVMAISNRHFGIASAVVVSLLFRVLVVLSTALFILAPTTIRRENVPIVVTSTFSGSLSDLNRTGTLPFHLLDGILTRGLEYPVGVTADVAYQTFISSTDVPGALLGTHVNATAGSLECEEAKVVVNTFYVDTTVSDSFVSLDPNIDIDFVGSDCQIRHTSPPLQVSYTLDLNKYWTAFFDVGVCSQPTSDANTRLILAAIEIQKTTSRNTSTSGTEGAMSTNYTIANSVQYICKPVMDMVPAYVSLNYSQNAVADVQKLSRSNASTTTTTMIDNVSASDLVSTAFSEENYSQLSFMTIDWFDDNTTAVGGEVVMGIRQAGLGDIPFTKLLDGDTLVTVGQKYFSAISALYAHLSLTQPASIPNSGTVQMIENRLQVKQLPVRIMEGLLGLIVILCLPVLFNIIKWDAVPRDPSTLLGLALLLSRSPKLTKLLEGTGPEGLDTLKQHLAGRQYASGITSALHRDFFAIQVDNQGEEVQTAPDSNHSAKSDKTGYSEHEKSSRSGWQPFVIGLIGRVCACVVLCLLIIALEVLLHFSQKFDGLTDADPQSYMHYSWAYASATLLILISLWFGSIDFYMKCLGPFFHLKQSTSASNSVNVSYLNEVSATTLGRSMRKQHWAIFVSTLAAVIASTFTIAVSGVFTMVDKPLNSTIQLEANSTWTANAYDYASTEDNCGRTNGATTAGLVLYANLTDPAWTYNQLAFPSLSISNPGNLSTSSTKKLTDTRINTKITATKFQSTCQVYQANEIDFRVDWGYANDYTNDTLFFNVSTTRCGFLVMYAAITPDSYFASVTGGNGASCFGTMYYWGRSQVDSGSTITFMGCDETWVDVDVDVDLLGPSLAISRDRPPQENLFSVRPSKTFYSQNNAYAFLPTYAQSNDSYLSPFFLAVVNGKNGIPLATLGDPKNTQKVADAVKNVNAVVRAQELSECQRLPINATTRTPPFNATSTQQNRLRLVQEPTGTRILEAMLAAVLVCTILATILADTRNVVPKNPCSIAAKASLLADSSLITDHFLPENAERMTDEELSAFAKTKTFRMGWFTDAMGQLTYKVDVLSASDEVQHFAVRSKG